MGRLVDVALRRRPAMGAAAGALVMTVSVLVAIVAGASPARAAGVTVTKDVQYGDAGGQQLLMDVYEPDGPGPFPAVIMIHGGVFTHGDKSALAPEGQWLASNGYAAFSIDYRLAPQFKYPAAVDDCKTAVEFVRSHADQYHVDPRRVGSLGASAGGYYTDMLATVGSGSLQADGRIVAAVSWSGVTDLTGSFRKGLITSYLGPSNSVSLEQQASPVFNVDPTDAPMFILNGTNESIPVQQAQEIADAYQKAGIPHTLLISPLQMHAENLGRQYYPQTIAFLNTYLKAGATSSPTTTGTPSPAPTPCKVTHSCHHKQSKTGLSKKLRFALIGGGILLVVLLVVGLYLLRRRRAR